MVCSGRSLSPTAVAALFLMATSICFLSGAKAYNVFTDRFPFCPPCEKVNTQYDVKVIRTPDTLHPAYMCWKLEVKSTCPNPGGECCTFFIEKVEFWINEGCPITGWTAVKGPITGPFVPTTTPPQQALFSDVNPPSAGSNVMRIQGINIDASEADNTIFCIKPGSQPDACKNLASLCYRPDPSWPQGDCILSLFDPYRKPGHPDGNDCCPLVDDPPPPPTWSKCNCNNSATATPFHFQNKVTKMPGQKDPANNMYCFHSQFDEIFGAAYIERCPKSRIIYKVEWLADVAKRSQLVAAYYRLQGGAFVDVTGGVAWKDPNTGPNVLKILDLNLSRWQWKDGVDICLELAGCLKLEDFCISEIDGRDYPVQCFYAIFDDTRSCCPQGWLGYGQELSGCGA